MERLKEMKVGVLLGGLSNEREVSLNTGRAVIDSLKRMGVDCLEIDAGRDLAQRLVEEKIDLAFIALHGRYGEDGCVQGLLELMGIPYTGSTVAASAMAMSKRLSKVFAEAVGIPTPPYMVVRRKESKTDSVGAQMKPPVVVKPANGGSSVNVSICREAAEIAPAIERALTEDTEAMVEEFVAGPLLTVGVVGDLALPAIEIETIEGFYDYKSKYTPGNTVYHLPARLPQTTLVEAAQMALRAHRALGCRGQTRSDFIVGPGGKVWFIELNTIPGMTQTSLLPKAAAHAGISFDELVLDICGESLAEDSIS
ncbi:MAG: D-alanine--D-alanine ligase [Nitrospinota bacterium]|nr:D-alanine--D-alanine ligase [Nitrospinota bacterium]